MKHYYICANRDSPYCVFFKNNEVYVFSTTSHKLLLRIKFIKKFIGKSIDDSNGYGVAGPEYNGNTIIVETSPLHYTYIGDLVSKFITKEPILKYISDIGNNLCPYPYAITKNFTYLIIEDKIIPN